MQGIRATVDPAVAAPTEVGADPAAAAAPAEGPSELDLVGPPLTCTP